MREILFRGKRDNGEWVIGSLVNDEDVASFICPDVSDVSYGDNGNRMRIGCWYRVDPSTVGQYTGLTDKYGAKIFEGDILQYFDDEIQVVEWSDEWSQIMLHTYGEHERKVGRKTVKEKFEGWNFLNDYPLEDMPKIGNIHDNPELLEGGQST